jgi:F-type H+-transporting ATPase subunit b
VSWASPIVSAAALLVVPATAGAAVGGEGSDAMTLFWQGVNLVLLFGLLVYLTREPIRKYFQDRREQVRGELDDASRVLSDAEARLAEWEARAERLDAEVEEIKEKARQRAARESERILAEAEASAERIRADAHAAVDQEVSRARAELRAEAGELATRLAGDLLRQSITEADQQRLVDEFVARVEASGDASQGGAS